MFKNILVPLNFAKENKKALDIAFKIAMDDGSAVHLLHVIEIIADTTFTEFQDFYTKLEIKAQKNMNTLTAPRINNAMDMTSTILFGDRVQEILSFAEKKHIDLIIMNSHKINLDNPSQGWGTISYKIGILSQCPVMLVK
ncbi:MAG: universal stress protein [Deltaproteobacteria bacterium]|nr:universal stress protein [Deltaproteobacteria bacterium]